MPRKSSKPKIHPCDPYDPYDPDEGLAAFEQRLAEAGELQIAILPPHMDF
jgi:hypothetical protein